jgi:hypothetical protein
VPDLPGETERCDGLPPCRAELGTVQALERRGQALTVAALQALARGDSAGAAHWLGRARWVHATPMVRVLEWVVDALRQAADAVPAATEDVETEWISGGAER